VIVVRIEEYEELVVESLERVPPVEPPGDCLWLRVTEPGPHIERPVVEDNAYLRALRRGCTVVGRVAAESRHRRGAVPHIIVEHAVDPRRPVHPNRRDGGRNTPIGVDEGGVWRECLGLWQQQAEKERE
jgi:hypothetical protein